MEKIQLGGETHLVYPTSSPEEINQCS